MLEFLIPAKIIQLAYISPCHTSRKIQKS